MREKNIILILRSNEKSDNAYLVVAKAEKLPKISDKLPFILSYLKNNLLQKYHDLMFDMTQPQCNERIRLLAGILFKTLISFVFVEWLPQTKDILAFLKQEYSKCCVSLYF